MPYTTFGTTTVAGAGTNQFDGPQGVYVSSDGYIFVADDGNNRISVWTQTGSNFTPLTTFGTFGAGSGQIGNPKSVTKASNGYIYVSDAYNNRVSVWTQTGNNFTHINDFGSGIFSNPVSTKVAPDGKIFIAEQYNDRISVWTISGGIFGELTTFGTGGADLNNLNQPTDIGFTSDGRILVADAGNNRVSVWSNSGNTFSAVATIGGSGSGIGQLSSPWSLAMAPNNTFYISDLGNQRVSVWTYTGSTFENTTTLGTTGTSGTANNQFSDPSGLYFTTNNRLFVADVYNHRISVWEICSAPQVLAQSASQTICGTNFATLTATVLGSGLTYNWWETSNPSTPVSNNAVLQTSVPGQYFLQAIGSCGSVYSNVVTAVSSVPATSITQQPTPQTICGNNPVALSVGATGVDIQYAWSNGATTSSIQTTTVGVYTVSVSGFCGTVQSNTVNVIDGGVATQIITQPIAQSVCTGTTASFSVSATGAGLTYAWNNGATTPSILTSVAGAYLVTVSGTCGQIISNAVNLTVLPLTSITSITSGVGVAEGSTTTLNVTAIGSQLTYQWSTGASTPNITIVEGGEYFVTVSGTCGIKNQRAIAFNLTNVSTNSGYTYQGYFGYSTNKNEQLGNPIGIAKGPDGRIFVADNMNGRISVWQKSGNTYAHVLNFGNPSSVPGIVSPGEFASIEGIAVASNGNIFITDLLVGVVNVWQKSGNSYVYLTRFGSRANSNSNEYLLAPTGVTVGNDGRIYVVDGESYFLGNRLVGKDRISVWTQSGNNFGVLTTFGSTGSGPENLDAPYGVTTTEDGKVYITEGRNNRISVWQKNGNSYTPFARFGTKGTADGMMAQPTAVRIASDGKIYVSDFGNSRISVWTSSGTNFAYVTTFSKISYYRDINIPDENYIKNSCRDIELVDKDNILVVDNISSIISMWRAPAPIFYWKATLDITAPTTFTGSNALLTWPSVTGLGNVKYCLRIKNILNNSVRTVCGITGNSYSYNPNASNVRPEASYTEFSFQVAAQDSAGNFSQWSDEKRFFVESSGTPLVENDMITAVSIYPNPIAGDILVVEGAKPGEVIRVHDAQGAIIISQQALQNPNQIDVSGLSKGIYVVKIGGKALKLVKN